MARANSNLPDWDFMKSATTNEKIFVGVDVSKAAPDVYRPDTKEVFKIDNLDEATGVASHNEIKKHDRASAR